MYDMNSGYKGYSMSKRAAEGYNSGEKVISNWNKADIIEEISEIDPEKAALFKKVKLPTLKAVVLRRSSWHHTSGWCNKTEFYSIDEDVVEKISADEIKELASVRMDKPTNFEKYKGSISYLVWSGTRNHPKAEKHELNDVTIEERRCFYIVYDESGKEILRKKRDPRVHSSEITRQKRELTNDANNLRKTKLHFHLELRLLSTGRLRRVACVPAAAIFTKRAANRRPGIMKKVSNPFLKSENTGFIVTTALRMASCIWRRGTARNGCVKTQTIMGNARDDR